MGIPSPSHDDNGLQDTTLPIIDDFFSDDSSFYGNSAEKAEYEFRAATYDPGVYWDVARWNVQCLAAEQSKETLRGPKREREEAGGTTSVLKTTTKRAKPPQFLPIRTLGKMGLEGTSISRPYNPFEGSKFGKQTSESLDDFLARLKPSKTSIETAGPWIWISNPVCTFRPASQDVAGFRQQGSKALAEYISCKLELEEKFPERPPGSFTRMLEPNRDYLEWHIIDLARQYGVTCGKWMLFAPPDEVDYIWKQVAKAVLNNELGCSAKVATSDVDSNGQDRLICVYTEDFSQKQDIQRVLQKLRQLGLVSGGISQQHAIYYKCDAYTHLDLVRGNEYKLRASMYSSNNFTLD